MTSRLLGSSMLWKPPLLTVKVIEDTPVSVPLKVRPWMRIWRSFILMTSWVAFRPVLTTALAKVIFMPSRMSGCGLANSTTMPCWASLFTVLNALTE